MPQSARRAAGWSRISRKDDFEIKEDGKVRPLTLFASEIQPITIVVMLDKSGSMKTNYGLVRAGAEAFVRRLMAGDKARIGTFSDKVEIQPEDFTADQEGLVRILRSGEPPVGPLPCGMRATRPLPP